jgi:hypothetical protein
MIITEILNACQRVLKDATILRSELLAEVNRQQLQAAALSRLPRLIHSEKVRVPAGTPGARMPGTYHHSLLTAYSCTHDIWLTVRTSRKALYDGYTLGSLSQIGGPYNLPFILEDDSTTQTAPAKECAVDGVSVDGYDILWVRPAVADEEVIRCEYYRKPVNMNLTDKLTPDGIPEELHSKLLVSGTLVEKLPESSLDDGLIAKLLQLHIAKYNDGLAMLREMFPFAPRHTPKARRRVREF